MPPSDKAWVIRFRYLPEDDAVLAEFENVELQTAADALRWAKEVDARLSTFGRKVDLIINLDGLRVKPPASREFGRQRKEVLARHSRRSFRFGGDRSTLTSVHTSAVLENAAANVYGSFEEARDALRRDRAGMGAPSSSRTPSSSRSPTSAPPSPRSTTPASSRR
jgi:hypothetical protein